MESARRGPTTLSKAFRSNRGLKRWLSTTSLDSKRTCRGSPSDYMGVLARHMVPIIHEKWSKVPRSLKDKIWCCLE
ncbi:hypothetical protein MKW92_012198, partial [Papaver armeniacum]